MTADDNKALLEYVSDISGELDKLNEGIDAIQTSLVSLREKSGRLSTSMEELGKQRVSESSDLQDNPLEDNHRQYVYDKIQKCFGFENNDPWLLRTRLSSGSIPRFIPIEHRVQSGFKTRFLSFLNFKGGVGKTTLTANLAAAFSAANFKINGEYAQPLRVLVVDLDLQGSLTDRCTNLREYIKSVDPKMNSSNLLFKPQCSKLTIDQLMLPFIQSPHAKIIPTNNLLDAHDNKAFFYQAFQIYEMRFNHRLWFHNEEFLGKYDLVFFDCPPRKTASVVCALVASDFVFVPTAPEILDIQSIFRTIQWLTILKSRLNLSLKIGGIIFNRTHAETKLSEKEVDFQTQLKTTIKDYFVNSPTEESKNYLKTCSPPEILKSFVPKRVGSNSILGDVSTALPGANREQRFITNLATEIYQRIYK